MKLRSVQVLRGLAATGVVLSHASADFHLGAAGVDLFFVISGYVITLSAQGKTPQAFLLDRVWRIYPIYWVAMLPWLFLAATITLPKLLSSVTLWPIYGPNFSQSYLRVAWTLSYEMLFYLAFAFAIWRKSPTIPLALFMASMALALVYPTGLTGFLGTPMIFLFLAGVGITMVPLKPKLALAFLPFALVLWGISDAEWLGRQEVRPDILRHFTRVLFWGLPAVAVFYAAICHERLFTRWAEPLVTLGAASYSIYLFHLLAIHGIHPVIDTALALGLGLAAWWFIERRIVSAKPSFSGRRQSEPYVPRSRHSAQRPS